MENLDIYILTSVMVILFLVFIIGIYRAVKDADMLKLVGKMFDNENIPNKEKKVIYKAIHRTMSDMESDGVYFPIEVKEELKRQKEELYCEYSGLPSVLAYGDKEEEETDEFLIGHS